MRARPCNAPNCWRPAEAVPSPPALSCPAQRVLRPSRTECSEQAEAFERSERNQQSLRMVVIREWLIRSFRLESPPIGLAMGHLSGKAMASITMMFGVILMCFPITLLGSSYTGSVADSPAFCAGGAASRWSLRCSAGASGRPDRVTRVSTAFSVFAFAFYDR
eukprot:gene15787-biopygen7118